MSGASHTPGPWTVRVWKKGKGRKVESINIGRSNPSEGAGPYPSMQVAQARCDELNAAIAKAEGRS